MTDGSRAQSPTSSTAEVLAGMRETSVWREGVHKDIHAHPEPGFQETRTALLVASKLHEYGYAVFEGLAYAPRRERRH
jgi:hippurate hydrolase